MWYFAWVLGLGFAVLLAILSAIWVEFEKGRLEAFSNQKNSNIADDAIAGDIDKVQNDNDKA